MKTRRNILEKTQELLLQYGSLNTSTKMIADHSSISHGTLFLHFETKENLFNILLSSNVAKFEQSLKSECNVNDKPLILVGKMLDVIALYENLLSRVYKDEAFLSDGFVKCIESYENLLKNILLDNYRKHSTRKISIVDAFVIIDAFLAQLRFYLIKKEYSVHNVSVIKQRKGRIIKLYNILFGDE